MKDNSLIFPKPSLRKRIVKKILLALVICIFAFSGFVVYLAIDEMDKPWKCVDGFLSLFCSSWISEETYKSDDGSIVKAFGIDNVENDEKVRSILYFMEMDCPEKQYRWLWLITVDGKKGIGNAVDYFDTPSKFSVLLTFG